MFTHNIREIFDLFVSSTNGRLNHAGFLHISYPISDRDITSYFYRTCKTTIVSNYLIKIYTVMRHLFKYDTIPSTIIAPKMSLQVRREILLEAQRLFRERFGEYIFQRHCHDCCRECQNMIDIPLPARF